MHATPERKMNYSFHFINFLQFTVSNCFVRLHAISNVVNTMYKIIYLHFRSNPLVNLYFFATVHSLMNHTNLIDSCQAHLPVQHASTIKLIRQKWYWCCDWQRATFESRMQSNPLVCSIGCPCSHWLFRFSVLRSNKTVKYIYIFYTKLFFFLN